MAKYALALGALVAIQGVAARTTHVPKTEYSDDKCNVYGDIVWEKTFPPCPSQAMLEVKCLARTDDVQGWTDERDCLCETAFFDDMDACNVCKKENCDHTVTQAESFTTGIKAMREKYCKAVPTGPFRKVWQDAGLYLISPQPGDKRQTCPEKVPDVTSYYTATKVQGPDFVRPSPAAKKEDKKVAPQGDSVSIKAAAAAKAEINGQISASAEARVELVSGSGPCYFLSKASATGALNGAKFSNATVSTEVYFVASMNCQSFLVNGNVQQSCGPVKAIEGPEPKMAKGAEKAAKDLTECPCVKEVLAPKNLKPAPAAVSASASVKFTVNSEICLDCSASAPAAPAAHKATVAHAKLNCTTAAAGQAGKKPAKVESATAPKTTGVSSGSKTGPKAAAGESSPKAAAGESSPKGAAGESSPKGAAGESSPKGAAGESSPKGAAVSVSAEVEAKVASPAKGQQAVAPKGAAGTAVAAAPVGTGVPPSPAVGPQGQAVTAGAGSTGVSAAVMAVAFAVYAL